MAQVLRVSQPKLSSRLGGGALGYEAGKRAVASGNWTEEEVADYLYDSWSNSAFY